MRVRDGFRIEFIIFLATIIVALGMMVGCGDSDSAAGNPKADGDVEINTDLDSEPAESINCTPFERICQENAVVRCNEEGNGWIFERYCMGWLVCEDGQCVDAPADGDATEVEDVEPEESEESDGTELELEDSSEYEWDDSTETRDEIDQVGNCNAGEKRCNGNVVEMCLPGGAGWIADQICNQCQTCVTDHCEDIPGCTIDGDEETIEQDMNIDEEEEDVQVRCTNETQPPYCQDQYLWFCNETTGEMERQNCAGINAVCMVVDGEPRCVGREDAYCLPDDEYACLPGLVCVDYTCSYPPGCRDMEDLQDGDTSGSTAGASDDLGHDPRSCLNKDLYGSDVIYRFQLNSNQIIDIELSGSGTSGGVLYVLEDCSNPNSCASGVSYVDNNQRHIRFKAPHSGTYYLVVDSSSGAMDYNLHVERVESSVCLTASTITGNAQLAGTTCGHGNDFDPGNSCRYGDLSGGAAGEDVFYKIRIGRNQAVNARLEIFTPGVDGVLYVLDDCTSPECEIGVDSAGPDMNEEAKVGSPSLREVFLVVDSKAECFTYKLTITYEQYSGCSASPFMPIAFTILIFGIAIIIRRRLARR